MFLSGKHGFVGRRVFPENEATQGHSQKDLA